MSEVYHVPYQGGGSLSLFGILCPIFWAACRVGCSSLPARDPRPTFALSNRSQSWLTLIKRWSSSSHALHFQDHMPNYVEHLIHLCWFWFSSCLNLAGKRTHRIMNTRIIESDWTHVVTHFYLHLRDTSNLPITHIKSRSSSSRRIELNSCRRCVIRRYSSCTRVPCGSSADKAALDVEISYL